LNGLAFSENTWTIGVNQHGARISTTYRLSVGDEVTVGNPVLGQSAKARVIRVAEEGRGFEVGLELSEPQDVWGGNTPENGVAGASGSQESESTQTPQGGKTNNAAEPGGEEVPASVTEAQSQTSDNQPEAPKVEQASVPVPHFKSFADFLQASRSELESLLSKTQEIQRTSSQAVQSLFEQVHTRLRQELEVAADGFVSGTHQRIQDATAAALEVFGKEASARQTALLEEVLAQSRAAQQEIDLSFKKGSEEHQHRLAESSAHALEEFHQNGKALFDTLRAELQNTLEDLKKKGAEDVSERLRQSASELADELRRRGDESFAVLQDELSKSGKSLVEETQTQMAELSQSSLGSFTQQAADAAQQQVSLAAGELNRATDETRNSLAAYCQQSIEAFQKQVGELTQAAVEKNSKTSEFLLQDLQSRLDQAARALQLTGMEINDASQAQAAR